MKCSDASGQGMLTGDFLAPYLLSSIDMGVGMMKMSVTQNAERSPRSPFAHAMNMHAQTAKYKRPHVHQAFIEFPQAERHSY